MEPCCKWKYVMCIVVNLKTPVLKYSAKCRNSTGPIHSKIHFPSWKLSVIPTCIQDKFQKSQHGTQGLPWSFPCLHACPLSPAISPQTPHAVTIWTYIQFSIHVMQFVRLFPPVEYLTQLICWHCHSSFKTLSALSAFPFWSILI